MPTKIFSRIIGFIRKTGNKPNRALVTAGVWTARTSPNAQQWRSVTWSPELGLFCAVAENGVVATQIMTSPDGVTWTARTSPNAQQWRSVTWSPELGLFCAVALDGAVATQIMTSPDGVTWTARTSPNAQQWRSVTWSPELGLFCAVAYNGVVAAQIMTSTKVNTQLYKNNVDNLLSGVTPTFANWTQNPGTNADIVDELSGALLTTSGIGQAGDNTIIYDLGTSQRRIVWIESDERFDVSISDSNGSYQPIIGDGTLIVNGYTGMGKFRWLQVRLNGVKTALYLKVRCYNL